MWRITITPLPFDDVQGPNAVIWISSWAEVYVAIGHFRHGRIKKLEIEFIDDPDVLANIAN